MNRIDFNTPNGTYSFSTTSGSLYTIKIVDDKKVLKRRNEDVSLRKDNEEIVIHELVVIEVGKSAVFVLEPLGEGDCTVRCTTPVIAIYEENK